MPKDKGKKGKKSGGKKKEAAVVDTTNQPPAPKEILLQEELEKLEDEHKRLKQRTKTLQEEYSVLQGKSNEIRTQNHKYASYIEHKIAKRKENIVTITDYCQVEIQKIQQEKEEMLKAYEIKKEKLRKVLLEKEQKLQETRNELSELEPLKEVQKEKEAKIKQLSREVKLMRVHQGQEIAKLRQQIEAEKKQVRESADQHVQEMSGKITKSAVDFLRKHTESIQDENKKLRFEILALIRETKALRDHKNEIARQHAELVREKLYAENLSRIRTQKEQALLDRLGIRLDKETEVNFAKIIEEMEKAPNPTELIQKNQQQFSNNIFELGLAQTDR